jgi:hypothetical protein
MNGIGRRWIISSAGVLGVAGVMRLFDAIWPFRYHDVLSENLKGAIFGHSLRSYGWNYQVVAVTLLISLVYTAGGTLVICGATAYGGKSSTA